MVNEKHPFENLGKAHFKAHFKAWRFDNEYGYSVKDHMPFLREPVLVRTPLLNNVFIFF